MKRHDSLFVGLLLLNAANAQSLPGPGDSRNGAISPHPAILPYQSKQKPVAQGFGRLPLSFESNQGQSNARVRFLSHSGENTLFLTPSEAVFSLTTRPTRPEQRSLLKNRKAYCSAQKISRVALRMQMIGANARATPLEQQPLAGRVNYFIGHDPGKWRVGVPTFGRVGFHGVYPGVDMVYYGSREHLEYDFVIAPHADPNRIQMRFAGAQRVQVNAAGELSVRAQGQELRWQKPAVYQEDASGKHRVAARFRLKQLPGGQTGVSFALGRYNTDRPLVIDPVLTYSTYLNVFGSYRSRGATCIAVDSSGSAYLGGDVSNADFPATPGVYQSTRPSPSATFVAKLNPSGTALVYATYLGGTTGNDEIAGIAVDSAGNAYVAGDAGSADFPTTAGAFQPTKGSTLSYRGNGFVTKINPTGTALLYSSYIGGQQGSLVNGLAIDAMGDAYICGRALSSDFPTTPGAFQRKFTSQGNGNAFVAKFNPTGTALVYSTFLGGIGASVGDPIGRDDDAHGIAVDSDGSAYVTGETGSVDFPVTPGAFQQINRSPHGVQASNVFVTKLKPDGSNLVYSTLLGGSGGDDIGTSIALDSSGSAYITGFVHSPDFPTTPHAFQSPQPDLRYPTSFIAKFDPTGSTLVYSTFLGGSTVSPALDSGDGYGIAVDSQGNAYVVGQTGCTDFPVTPGAFQRTKKSSTVYSAFLTRLNATGTALLYSTYLGGSGQPNAGGDSALGVALDRGGNVYITGITHSNDFPVTPGALQTDYPVTASSGTSFVTKLSTAPIFPDLNNDGNTDLLIQNASTGVIASWFMHGAARVGGTDFSLTPPIEYALVGAGDFSGNGNTTLVLQSSITNKIAFWYTGGANNATIPGGNFVNVTPDAGWKVVGIGDFNSDGKSDLVFQNQTTNQIVIWFMNGYLCQGGIALPFVPDAGWNVAGTGDLNADGFTDIVFQNQTSNQIALWFMNGATYAGGTVLPTVPASGWRVVGVGDYNGDGSADLLFQNQTTYQAVVWYLNGGIFAGGEPLSMIPPSGFQIVGPR